MGDQVEDQQVSCLWQGSYLLSVSLSGYINYLDVNNPEKPLRIIRDSSVYVYTVNGDSLTEKTTFKVSGEITVIAYSPDGQSLTVSSDKKIVVFDAASYQEKKSLIFHSARVMCLDWSQDSSHIVSGSIDTNVIIWDPVKGERTDLIKGAHPLSVVSGVSWLNDKQFVSCGHDCCIKVWEMA